MRWRSSLRLLVVCSAVLCEASWLPPLASIAARARRLLPGERRLSSYDEVEAIVGQRQAAYDSVEEEAWDLIQRHHINRRRLLESDWRPGQQRQQQQQYPTGRLHTTASRARVAAMVQQLGDRYSRLLPPSEYVALHSRTTGAERDTGLVATRERGSLGGMRSPLILAVLAQLVWAVWPGAAYKVASVAAGSPAEAAGIRPGDVLVEVNGQAASRLTPRQVQIELAATTEPQVNVTVLRDGVKREFVLTPAERYRPSAIHEVLPSGIGYVRIEDFTETTAEELHEAMARDLKACEAIIIDLRASRGGMVGTAADIAAFFLPHGTVIARLTRADGTTHDLKSLNRQPNLHTALCVLVDGQTASAGEALAAALADHGRAVVWGRPTFGKTSAQMIAGLSDGSGLVLSVLELSRPSGDNWSSGVHPSRLIPRLQMNARLPLRIRYSGGGNGDWSLA